MENPTGLLAGLCKNAKAALQKLCKIAMKSQSDADKARFCWIILRCARGVSGSRTGGRKRECGF